MFTPSRPAGPLQPRPPARITAPGRLRRSGRRWRSLRRLAAALLTVAAAFAATRTPPTVGTPVLVAAHDLLPGTPLSSADFDTRSITFLPDGALLPGLDLRGRQLTGAVRHGEVITDVRLVPITGPEPGPGRRAVSVTPQDPAVVDLLSPGMLVAVIGLGPDGDPKPLTDNAIVMGMSPQVQAGGRRPVLLAVTTRDAVRVSGATLTGEVALQLG